MVSIGLDVLWDKWRLPNAFLIFAQNFLTNKMPTRRQHKIEVTLERTTAIKLFLLSKCCRTNFCTLFFKLFSAESIIRFAICSTEAVEFAKAVELSILADKSAFFLLESFFARINESMVMQDDTIGASLSLGWLTHIWKPFSNIFQNRKKLLNQTLWKLFDLGCFKKFSTSGKQVLAKIFLTKLKNWFFPKTMHTRSQNSRPTIFLESEKSCSSKFHYNQNFLVHKTWENLID